MYAQKIKKWKKRAVAFLLAVIMAVGNLPLTAFADTNANTDDSAVKNQEASNEQADPTFKQDPTLTLPEQEVEPALQSGTTQQSETDATATAPTESDIILYTDQDCRQPATEELIVTSTAMTLYAILPQNKTIDLTDSTAYYLAGKTLPQEENLEQGKTLPLSLMDNGNLMVSMQEIHESGALQVKAYFTDGTVGRSSIHFLTFTGSDGDKLETEPQPDAPNASDGIEAAAMGDASLYFLNPSNIEMQEVNGKKKIFVDGILQVGLFQIDGNTYYADATGVLY